MLHMLLKVALFAPGVFGIAAAWDLGARVEAPGRAPCREAKTTAYTAIAVAVYGLYMFCIGICLFLASDPRGKGVTFEVAIEAFAVSLSLALFIFGATSVKRRTVVSSLGIVETRLWRKAHVRVRWEDVIEVTCDGYEGPGSGWALIGCARVSLRLIRASQPEYTLKLYRFPFRRAALQIVLANLPQTAKVDPSVHRCLDRIKMAEH